MTSPKWFPAALAAALLTAGPVVTHTFADDAPATSPATMPATAPAASADALLADFDALKPPVPDQSKRTDRAYVKQFNNQVVLVMQKQAAVAKAFLENYQDHPRAGEMLLVNLQATSRKVGSEASIKSVDDFLAKHADSASKPQLIFVKAALITQSDTHSLEETLTAIDAAEKLLPDKDDTLELRAMAIEKMPFDQRLAGMKKLVAEHPGKELIKRLEGRIARAERVGQPFDLSFSDAVTGKTVSVAGLKGKVVVIDFWATWCGPCVAEMPKMKKRYAEYKDKGVEFIGVSLDEPEADGGKAKLLAFVEKNEVSWPQYYLGKAWESDFSRSWNINSIPAVFILDADGKLYSTEAGQDLDKLIPELLNKRDNGAKS